MLTPCEFWLKAADWGSYMRAGDPGACMYGFDEHGLVRSEEHRQACLSYIDADCRAAADLNGADDPEYDYHGELDALVEYLNQAPVG